ncbi:peptidase M15 [Priestia aryabhattai]|uniref:M15 family metallopeptidase n=1 Tax=Bacillaceae TaxID=186817 RepID=UPI000BA1158F|nr:MULTISPECIES: M15 family metallopeptidase [Bacillaceae]MBY6023419.1 M15 family metallopeptidase [Nitratireductor sp. DP7N14-4]OZT12646.1 peptidase M15 [Priestia aryabhattai]USY55436.1 M15 family metallopeptidase [Bacillus sp. 1780r2a1]MDT2048498.1 M15 family metallopeptidase [Priestia flexa]TDB53894.1 M15 family peptidase [Bacillus sp. CBEL-1]
MNAVETILKLLLIGIIAYGLIFFVQKNWPISPFGPSLSEFKDATDLHPDVAEKRDQLIEKAKAQGIDVVITDGFRSFEEQDELYARGRTTEGQIVTYSKGGESYHNYGLAIDFALRVDNGDIIWDMEYDGNGNGKSDWMEVAEIGKKLGFEWGGDWQGFKDYPHFQLRPEDIK